MKPGRMTGKIFLLESELPAVKSAMGFQDEEYKVERKWFGARITGGLEHGPVIRRTFEPAKRTPGAQTSMISPAYERNKQRTEQILTELKFARARRESRAGFDAARRDVQAWKKLLRAAAEKEAKR